MKKTKNLLGRLLGLLTFVLLCLANITLTSCGDDDNDVPAVNKVFVNGQAFDITDSWMNGAPLEYGRELELTLSDGTSIYLEINSAQDGQVIDLTQPYLGNEYSNWSWCIIIYRRVSLAAPVACNIQRSPISDVVVWGAGNSDIPFLKGSKLLVKSVDLSDLDAPKMQVEFKLLFNDSSDKLQTWEGNFTGVIQEVEYYS